MTTREIQAAESILSRVSYELENEYIENEGEITDSTEAKEQQIMALRQLLCTEGIDTLGRWLKAKEDKVKAIKAEKDYLTRRQKAEEETMDYIKGQIYNLMTECGEDKLKGSCGYSFAPYLSKTTTVNKDILKEQFQSKVETALRNQGIITPDITITLGASVKNVPEGVDLPDYFSVTERPSCKFTKPRAAKDEAI